MNPRIILLVGIIMSMASCSLLGSGSDSSANATSADDETSASMADSEGGAASVIEASVSALYAEGAKGLEPRTLSYTSGSSTPTVVFYDAAGNVTSAALAVKAQVSWTRSASFTSTRATGTSTHDSSLTFTGLGTSIWSLSGTVDLQRSTTVKRTGTTTTSTISHAFNLTLNSPSSGSSHVIAGGTATTSGSFSVNGSSSLTRAYVWTFNGDGTASLTTSSGTVVDVSVTVEGAS